MMGLICGVGLALAQAPTEVAASVAEAGVTSYPSAYFAAARPNTAFDMIARLPGFTFEGGEDVRGFAGAAGNVLVDGQRRSTKSDSLASILKRIPASSVVRIDLIRGGAPGIDMQGQTVLANVILRTNSGSTVTTTGSVRTYSDGRVAPTLQLETARRNAGRLLAGSVRYYDEEGGEQGTGLSRIVDGVGGLLSEADARLKDRDRGLEVRASRQSPALGGLTHLNGALDVLGTDKAERLFFLVPARRPSEETTERFRRVGGEMGGDYTRSVGRETELEILGVQSLRRRTYDSQSNQDSIDSVFSQRRTSGESILRATLTRRPSADFSFEAGGEGVFNFLDGASRLTLDGAAVALPNARVGVEERRGEGFATANWRISGQWRIEAGLRAEASSISQSGDTKTEASFFFPKPRAVATWSPSETVQVRARVEREVSQLDFADFVATANLATGVVNAGNATLEPERRWVLEAALEKHFWGNGAVVLTLRHVALQAVIDQAPVEGFNAPGNIGSARREVAILDLTLPLAKVGLRGGLLKANAQATWSRVTDPTAGRSRMISEDIPFSGSVVVTNDMPRLRSTWTFSLDSGDRRRSYLIDEIQTIRRGPSVDLAWEYKPTDNLAVLAELTNLTGHVRKRQRDIYAGLRSEAPLAADDRLRIRVPAAFHLSVRRSW